MSTSSSPSLLRRRLLQSAGALATIGWPALGRAAADPWVHAQSIIDQFAKPLAFPPRDFVITDFGARPCTLVKVMGDVEIKYKGEIDTPAPGSADACPAIRAAIEAASKAGGGRVLIPKGNWYCKGPIVLRSHVHVHLAAGAEIFFSANPRDFARDGEFDCGPNGKLVLSRWQGNDCLNFSSMVYARGQKHIALTGEDWTSVLNGQAGVPFEDGSAPGWWSMNPKGALPGALHQGVPNPANAATISAVAPGLDAATVARIQGEGARWRSDERYLPALSEAGVPVAQRVFGLGHYLRPSLIEFVDCEDVLLQGYLAKASPFWIHHPVQSRRVHLSRVRMDSIGPNSDGFDPESCDTLLVDGCLFNTGDDCIAIKSGKNRDTQYGPTRNMVIQNCVMNSGHGGVTLGSEMAAGIEHVYAQNIEFRNAFWASNPLWTAIRLKTNMNRGGYLRHFYARQLTLPNGVDTRAHPYKPGANSSVTGKPGSIGGGAVITFDCDYAQTDDSVRTRVPAVSDVHIAQVKVANVKTPDGEFSCYQAIAIMGPVASSFNGPAGTAVPPVTNVSISDSDFGQPRNAAEPVYLHNVKGLVLRNVRIGGKVVNAELQG
ncbi:glycoside hydrolase family 28 protein [Massilia sp. TS11]|uniref:glycoside hydrolase family 28 protein n=1 Tax=Massilia sp. TS11 TaxID=2908003 RepID=UPI001EDB9AE2|nr:glycoside hydrolase family 28 protein [Massilia sp. TS11]MCG2583747.1 glycoside hydrolase family 28 protein [Massilia sp. TS11]